MLISWNWLQEYVTLPEGTGVEEAAERLTMTGCEVEDILYPCSLLNGVLTAEIEDMKPHPTVDNLLVVDIVTPSEHSVCITAAQNLSIGDIVPYAPPGAAIADGTILTEKDFSGVKSQGMMLSADEIGLPDVADEFGILRLPANTPLGVDFKSNFGLNDILLDISITPNRGDLLSIIGLARELYALFPGARLAELPSPTGLNDNSWNEDFGNILLNDKGCRCYALGLASNISVKPSPIEARIKLALMGMRPISNVVDATNLVMLLTGQPLHAFDLSLLPSRNIEVRPAIEDEHFTTLDEKEHILSEYDMLITSDGEPIALAGVMGGLNTEIKENTSTIVIESANFEAARVSTTSRRLGIPSEAAFRFARGVDPLKARPALFFALGLIAEWGGAEAYHTIKYAETSLWEPREIVLRSSVLKRMLLWDDLEKSSEILERLGLSEVERGEDSAKFLVPSWRPDLGIEEDLVEEAGRIRGYDKIKPRLPGKLPSRGQRGPFYVTSDRLRDMAMSRGYTEVVTCSFIGPDSIDQLSLSDDDPRANPFLLSNPMSKEQSCMRTNMLPGMLKSLENSIRSGWRKPIRVFEIGRVFSKEVEIDGSGSEEHSEKEIFAGLVFPGFDRRSPYGRNEEDFFSVKGDVLAFLLSSGIEAEFIQGQEPFGHSGQTAFVIASGERIGSLLRVKPHIEESLDISGPVYYFELNMDIMMKGARAKFSLLSQYPSVYRDISILVSSENSCRDVTRDLVSISGELIHEIRLFDIYEGKGIPEGYRSLAFSLAYRASDRTLSDEDVDTVHNDFRAQLQKKGYTLR